MKDLQTKRAPHALKGSVSIPGDKSVSHRAIMLSAIAEGETRIHGLLEGEDVMATVAAFEAMGVEITAPYQEVWSVNGVNLRDLKKPEQALDMGNSGTSARLIMGILAGQDFETTITGDESLRKRPMKRVTEPLIRMGASFEFLENDGCLPIKVTGNSNLEQRENYELPVASAQIKSAILLAGLYAEGTTSIIEKEVSRNHTEIMMRQFGISINSTANPSPSDGSGLLSIEGKQNLKSPGEISVPADPSSGAFFITAAMLVPDSEIEMYLGMNPTRTGFIDVVTNIIGGDIEDIEEEIDQHEIKNEGEIISQLAISYKEIKMIDEIKIPSHYAPDMIDEYPILAVLAAGLDGVVEMQGIGELRVKESDRIAAMEEGLKACGVKVESGKDWMRVYGTGKVKGGARVKTYMDHRIAMSFIILGLIAENPIVLDDVSPIMTSFPTFFTELKKLGVDFGL